MGQELVESLKSVKTKINEEARCQYFGKCGGCSAQHVEYSVQLLNSRKIVAKLLDVEEEVVEVFSGEEYNYRNRMDFIVYSKGVGLRKKGQWDKIVDVSNCSIAMPKINSLLFEVREFLSSLEDRVDYFHLHKQTGSMKYCLIRVSKAGDSSVVFTLNEDSSSLSSAIETVKEYAKKSSANNVLINYVPAKRDQSVSENYFVCKGSDQMYEELCGMKYKYFVQGFFQNNPIMAEKLVAYVKEIFGTYYTKETQLLDLYGGVGTFGVALADLFEKVFIMELFAPSIEIAKKNIAVNDLNNVEAIVGDVKQFGKLGFDKHKQTFVLVDPPRSGIVPKALVRLKELAPPVLVYVSCNPKQLSKDLVKLRNWGYYLKSCALFDLFPQTAHMEVVVELVLKEK